MFILVIIAYGLIGIAEITPLIKAKDLKKIILCSSILVIAFIMNFLIVLNVKIPSPAVPMDDFWKSLYGFLFS